MTPSGRLDRDRSVLVVIDLQEKLVPAITGGDAVVERAGLLLQAAARVGVPAIVTEHVADKIGAAVSGLSDAIAEASVFAKSHFAATDEPGFLDLLASKRRDQVIVCGTEAHVCVLQTAIEIAASGRETFVVTDASGSRRLADRDAGYQRLVLAGVAPVTSEMVVFEWARAATDPAFRDLHRLIK